MKENEFHEILKKGDKAVRKQSAEKSQINLTNDKLFGYVMCDQQILKGFLEEVLDITIVNLEVTISQYCISSAIKVPKSVRLDIYAKDDKGNMYDLEMQRVSNPGLPKRSRYYTAMMDLDSFLSGDDYRLLKKNYVIFICSEDPFGHDLCRYTFKNMCCEVSDRALEDECCKVFFYTKGRNVNVNDTLAEILTYIEDTTEEEAEKLMSPLARSISQKVSEVMTDPDKRKEVEEYEYQFQQSLNDAVEREVGKAVEKAVVQAKEEATERTVEIFVVRLFENGMDEEQIAVICQKSIDVIHEILLKANKL